MWMNLIENLVDGQTLIFSVNLKVILEISSIKIKQAKGLCKISIYYKYQLKEIILEKWKKILTKIKQTTQAQKCFF